MPEDPETTETPTAEAKTPEQLLEELKATRSELERERQALTAEREAVGNLRDTVVSMVRPQQPQADEIEDDDEPLPGDEDFDNDRVGATARTAAGVFRRGLQAYDRGLQSELAALRSANLEAEWERVKAEDPKNFSRLEKGMREYFSKNQYQPGFVRSLFYRMRGEYMPKLLELDRAEREREPSPTPASTAMPKKSSETYDTLTPEQIKTIRGLGVTPASYFGLQNEREPKFEKGYLKSLGFAEEGASK